MKMFDKLVDKIVYRVTKKPKHCVEVKNPPQTAREKLDRPNDARQVQYNNWSKAKHIYSGSYLPKDDKKLLRQGWAEENVKKDNSSRSAAEPTFYRRKSTNQWVRKDPGHWHWYDWWKVDGVREFRRDNKNKKLYLDKYGEPCKAKSKGSHIEEQE